MRWVRLYEQFAPVVDPTHAPLDHKMVKHNRDVDVALSEVVG